MADPAQTAQEPLHFERTFTTGPGYPTKVTNGLFRYLLLTPRRLVTPVIILVIFVGIAVANGYTESQTELPLLIPGTYLVLMILLYGSVYLRTRRSMRTRIPVGSVFAVGFRNETFALRSPQVSSEVAYAYYRSAERRGDFVLLRARSTRSASLVPAEIFTDESLGYFQSKIASSTP